jgi:hypothetical protein
VYPGGTAGVEDGGGASGEIGLYIKTYAAANSTTIIKATQTISQEFVFLCSAFFCPFP